ncbi:MAG: hypothetical protein ABI451_10450 [Dokdonella sp.]
MTDFELLRDLRRLQVERQPSSDLWPLIATRIGARDISAPGHSARRWRLPFAIAASIVVLLSVGSVWIATHMQRSQDVSDMSQASADARLRDRPSLAALRAQALANAPGGDPRLASAALVVDIAHQRLEQAIAENPDAVFLVGLLNQTTAQRTKLARLGMQSG